MNINSIRLSIQNALLGYVTPNLRAVYINNINDVIQLVFYYDNPPCEDEIELSNLVDTEFIADFPSPEYKTDYQVIVLPKANKIPKDGVCVYKRYEN